MFKNPAGIDPRNVGVSWQRTEWSKTPGRPNLEKIFMQKWDRQNRSEEEESTAQMLMRCPAKEALETDFEFRDDTRDDLLSKPFAGAAVYKLTRREYQIIATVIQWLGSNVGFAFLQECLRQAGYRINWVNQEYADMAPEKNQTTRFSIIRGAQVPLPEGDSPKAEENAVKI